MLMRSYFDVKHNTVVRGQRTLLLCHLTNVNAWDLINVANAQTMPQNMRVPVFLIEVSVYKKLTWRENVLILPQTLDHAYAQSVVVEVLHCKKAKVAP
jgi:hypothetical protein